MMQQSDSARPTTEPPLETSSPAVSGLLDQSSSAQAIAALDLLDTAEQGVETALAAYLQLRRTQVEMSTLLRSTGTPLTLPRDPVRVYLLPAHLTNPGPRWMLAQYAATSQLPAAVQLIFCRRESARVVLDPAADDPWTLEVQHGGLDARAQEVRCYPVADQVQVHLIMGRGRLELKIEDARIVDGVWRPGKGQTIAWKQADQGPGERIIGRERGAEHWPDDRLLTPDEEPIALPDGLIVGQVHTAAQDPDHPQRVYFGNSRARIHGFDLGDSRSYQSSPILQGTPRDLLVVDGRRGDPVQRRRLLAICSDGIAYLLQPREVGEEIAIVHRQRRGIHLRQLLPLEDDHLLALDRYRRLLPLVVADPIDEDDLLDAFADRALNSARLSETWQQLGAAPQQLSVPLRQALATVALDLHLGCYDPRHDDAAGQRIPTALEPFCHWLTRAYLDDEQAPEAPPDLERAKLHDWLLRRFWAWIELSSHASAAEPALIPLERIDHWLNILFRLLTPPDDAPDLVWTGLLQRADQLGPWIEQLPTGAFKSRLDERHRRWWDEPATQDAAVVRRRGAHRGPGAGQLQAAQEPSQTPACRRPSRWHHLPDRLHGWSQSPALPNRAGVGVAGAGHHPAPTRLAGTAARPCRGPRLARCRRRQRARYADLRRH
jgi:hypothetical protein